MSGSSHSLHQAESSRSGAARDISRPPSGPANNRGTSAAPPQIGLSFDDAGLQPPDYGEPFASSFHFSPLDLSTPSPDHTAAGGMQETAHLLQHGAPNPIHRFDAMMFPSGDPLAYPNQPRVDFAGQRPGASVPGANPSNMMQQDPSQFYIPPQMYDNIEGQLMGPLPPYMMQSQVHPGFGFSPGMYSDPMLPLQPHLQGGQPQPHVQQQRPHRRFVRSQQTSSLRPHRRPREPEDLLANTPWHGIFPQHAVD
jgi:hypothetical protein